MSGNVVATKAFVDLMMTIAKYVYIIVSVVLVCYASYFLFTKMNRPVAGLLVFIGGFLAALFYYVKWFVASSKAPDMPVGLCPDFLTPISPGILSGVPQSPTSSKTIYCMDFVGVSRNGALKIADPNSVNTQMQDTTWYSIPINTDDLKTASGLNRLKQQVQAKGLTWVALFPDM